MTLLKVSIAVVLPLVVDCVCEPGLQAYCIGICRRPNTSVETEPCATHCPNGGRYIDGYCHCPPLRYRVCCERDETAASGDCARHCTWANWLSWGDCSTDCGCGTRIRKRWLCGRTGLSWSERIEDCNFRDKNSTDERVCTKQCTRNDQSQTCQLCSWNNWQPWSSCSQTCGGGQRSRSRSPCCCEGQSNKDCQFDCRLWENDSVQTENCSEICFNNGSFSSSICHCGQGYSGSCCTEEVTDGKCTKCTWGMWGRWGPCNDSKNGGGNEKEIPLLSYETKGERVLRPV
ncbi:A disintegrin and metalloproteinase with thrombospondin motifs adt-2-like [Haliotis rubra]|uniref:A disintegrin and metalloproteinase with thrombospondin motifs adt-2-like n=1 Tax=Haliotis rubra TaxID=36100 RepID=UPI001EE50B5E|nr:A disintegrin and metalloproteinase with thrombospondin motifs adt-2-like [Haliotis rubra]